jgi:hypothetical protein
MDDPARTARFSEDEKLPITSMTALITVWQVDPVQKIADSQNQRRYIGNNLEIALAKHKSLAITLSLSRVSTTDRSNQILVWRVADAFILHRINPPSIGKSQPMFTCFALSPDGAVLVVVLGDGTTRLFGVPLSAGGIA